MGKRELEALQKNLIEVLVFICFMYASLGIFVVIALHAYVPFFPVLFLYDFCMLFGYSLFLRRVLKKEWSECQATRLLSLKYIIIPWAVMDTIVMLCYIKETMIIVNKFELV